MVRKHKTKKIERTVSVPKAARAAAFPSRPPIFQEQIAKSDNRCTAEESVSIDRLTVTDALQSG